jgi:hypothetical protein
VIKDVFAVVGDVQLLETVIVVVTDADALAPAGMGQAGFFSDIGKRAVVVVVVEMIGRSLLYGGVFEFRAVDDEDVGPAVVVVVEDRDAGAGGFDDVFFGGDTAEGVGHGEAGLFRDVREVSGRLGRDVLRLTGREANRQWKKCGDHYAERDRNRKPGAIHGENHRVNG